MLAAGPGIAVLFPLWLLGGLARRWCAAGGFGGRIALAAGSVGIVLLFTEKMTSTTSGKNRKATKAQK